MKETIRFGIVLLILFSIFSQIYSLIQLKAFWLDEWFILYNIKYKTYSKLFGNLFYIQQFPRVYLVIIKVLADISNYNYYILRLLPSTIQIVNIFFIAFLVRKIIFPNNENKGLLFILFFLSFQITIFYFTQLKQYTMEMFFSLLAIYYFHYLSKYYNRISIRSGSYILFLVGVFIGSFFSYTFPIVITPLLFSLFITLIYNFTYKKIDIKAFIPIIVFLISLIINYFTDLQYVLNNKEQYSNLDEYIMSYDSTVLLISGLYNIIRLFAYNFIFSPQNYHISFAIILYLIKITIIFLTLVGLIVKTKEQIVKMKTNKFNYLKSLRFRENPSIAVYFLLLFILTLVLYFLKILPIGQARINYFSFLFTTYFLITGLFSIINRFKRIKYLMITIVLFAIMFQNIRGNLREFKNKNLLFDQEIYENVGNAIIRAQKNKLPIIVFNNEFYPSSIMKKQEELLIKSHHLNKPQTDIKYYITDSVSFFALLKDSIKGKEYIKLNKYNFKIMNSAIQTKSNNSNY